MNEDNLNNSGNVRVSVIVPNYNHAPYLKERIDSILNQENLPAMELILLDDCSTDRSRDILESYRSEPKVSHIIYNKENSGTTFAQWKRGLELARGEYVWIAESDDTMAPDFLSRMVGLLDANPNAVMAFCGSRIIDSMGNEIPGADWDRFGKDDGRTIVYNSHDFIKHKLLRNCMVYNASMVLFRRSAMPAITDRHLGMRLCGDWLFWQEMARKGDVVHVCEKLNGFRQHTVKVSNSAQKEGRTYTEGLPIVCDMADYLQLSKKQRKALTGRIFKRLTKFPGLTESHPEILANLRRLCGLRSLSPFGLILYYEIDKMLNITNLSL